MSWKEDWVSITGHFRSDPSGSVQCAIRSAKGGECASRPPLCRCRERSVEVGIIPLRRVSLARRGLKCSTFSTKPRCPPNTVLLAAGTTQISALSFVSVSAGPRLALWHGTPHSLIYTSRRSQRLLTKEAPISTCETHTQFNSSERGEEGGGKGHFSHDSPLTSSFNAFGSHELDSVPP